MSPTAILVRGSRTPAGVDVAGVGGWMRVSAFPPTGPAVLAVAADLLPVVVDGVRVSYGDLHRVLFETLSLLRPTLGVPHQHRLADEALDLAAGYLMLARLVEPQGRTSQTVRSWLLGQDLAGVRQVLVEAGRFWHCELRAALK